MTTQPILNPGENCWKKQNASRAAVLIDGENYYTALHETLKNAKHSVFILGWDLDTRIRLVRNNEEKEAFPAALGPFIDNLDLLDFNCHRNKHARCCWPNHDA